MVAAAGVVLDVAGCGVQGVPELPLAARAGERGVGSARLFLMPFLGMPGSVTASCSVARWAVWTSATAAQRRRRVWDPSRPRSPRPGRSAKASRWRREASSSRRCWTWRAPKLQSRAYGAGASTSQQLSSASSSSPWTRRLIIGDVWCVPVARGSLVRARRRSGPARAMSVSQSGASSSDRARTASAPASAAVSGGDPWPTRSLTATGSWPAAWRCGRGRRWRRRGPGGAR